MPLHLLGKKSWNVYNPAAIARVRADEAAAAAREEAEDQAHAAHDGARRLALLRGTTPPPPSSTSAGEGGEHRWSRSENHDAKRDARKRRKLAGEDDTDRDVRLAREDLEGRDKFESDVEGKRLKGEIVDAPIEDHAGHIQLFIAPPIKSVRAQKNEEAEMDKKRKERELEDQYTMRFSNAAGNRVDVKEGPWYLKSASGKDLVNEPGLRATSGVNAFGREDAGRGKRDERRLNAADPMAMMKQAQVKIKQVEKERDLWKQERDEETRLDERRSSHYQRRRKGGHVVMPEDEPDDFSLDDPARRQAELSAQSRYRRDGGADSRRVESTKWKTLSSRHWSSHAQRDRHETTRSSSYRSRQDSRSCRPHHHLDEV